MYTDEDQDDSDSDMPMIPQRQDPATEDDVDKLPRASPNKKRGKGNIL
jgi:hypothetical protein